ncbi:hypothetical protein ACIPWY_35310 [Streptomyces sp. NPDC090032]|uniref:hypothetical protein n=1 Tax=unclassified Streptomyces TaxID=2593676 RepID=UPI003724C278
MSKRQYVARGVPGGYRIWDNKGRRWWGDLYELCPDNLLAELNSLSDPDKITDLLKRYRALVGCGDIGRLPIMRSNLVRGQTGSGMKLKKKLAAVSTAVAAVALFLGSGTAHAQDSPGLLSPG